MMARIQAPEPLAGPAGPASAPLPPGWYRDPVDPTAKRYWDGERWKNTTVPASGLPELPHVAHPDDEWVSRPVFDVLPVHSDHRHWTLSRVAVIVLGALGWAGAAAGILVLLTGGDVSALAVVGLGLAVWVACALLAAAFYSMDRLYSLRASRRARRLFGVGWTAALVVAVVLIATHL